MSDCPATRGQARGWVVPGVELKHSHCVVWGVCALGYVCWALMSRGALSAPSVARGPRSGMRKHPQGCSTISLPTRSFSHPLTAAAAPIYAQYLLSCSLRLEKGGERGLLLKASS